MKKNYTIAIREGEIQTVYVCVCGGGGGGAGSVQ